MKNGTIALCTFALAVSAATAQQYPSWPGQSKPAVQQAPAMPSAPPGFIFMPTESQIAPASAKNSSSRPTAKQEKLPLPSKDPNPAQPPATGSSEIVEEAFFSEAPAEPYIQQLTFWEGTRGPATWFRAEYLLWWGKQQDAPPLAVAGPVAAPISVLGGGTFPFEDELSHGGRFTVGSWLDFRQTLAFQASYFFLGQRVQSGGLASAGVPLVSRVFIDANTATPSSILLATPGALPLPPQQTGSSTVTLFNRLWGADATLKKELHRANCGFIDFLGGFRFVQLDEGLTVSDVTKFGPAPVVQSDALIISVDEFGTHNQFFGGELGLASEVRMGPVFVDVYGKTAFGNNRQTVRINGATSTRAPPPPLLGNSDVVGGVSALTTNIGRYRRDQFTTIPQAGANVGFQLNDYIRATVGYTFMYISNVVRPGDQIDTTINPTLIPRNQLAPAGPARPSFGFRDTDYWVQGINIGLEMRY